MRESSSAQESPRAGVVAGLRTLLALLAVVPGLVLGLVTWIVRRDRRRAINGALELWARLGLPAAGVRLDVAGGEVLALRPAVFVFNHQSGIDPLLVCALLRRDFVGVAKREIRRYPLLGAAFAFAGTIFLDRADRAQALRALAPAVDTLRAGIAVAFTPEGTRSAGARLGAFKKGAFRLALAARVPIVPVVIQNARDVLPRGAWLMRGATVRVRVLAPVATGAWCEQGLDAEIERVRARMDDALEP